MDRKGTRQGLMNMNWLMIGSQGKKVMKIDDDGTVMVGEQPINDFRFTTLMNRSSQICLLYLNPLLRT